LTISATVRRMGGNGKLNMPEFISACCLWMYTSWCWSSMESWSSWSKWQSLIGDLQTGHLWILAPSSRLKQGSQIGVYVVGEVNPNIWDITAPPLKFQLLHLLSLEQGPLPSQIFDGICFTELILSKIVDDWF
jgi:hypothetical protein